MKRSAILAFIINLVLLLSTSSCMGSPPAASKPKAGEEAEVQYRALSLRVLQARLAECQGKGGCAQELVQLAGISRVHGHAVDAANRDVILIGQVEETLPPLFTDDLAIAFRNAWMKYAPLKGNTYYYSNPGCTIDPNPSILRQLEVVGERMNNTKIAGEVEKLIQAWHQTCHSPQSVNVMGIPFDTRFGWVMVKADYDMKRIVDGSDSMEIPGLKSQTDMILEQAKNDVLKGRALSVPLSSMNRYWFYPGKNLYEEDEGIALVKQCPVVLRTEEEYLSAKGEVVGKGQPSPFAQKFAKAFTEHYAEVARKRPIYIELESLFRFVAAVKIIKFKEADKKAGLDLRYFLDRHPIGTTSVNREVPGISNVKQFSERKDQAGGYTIFQFWLPSCGGVEINMTVGTVNFVRDTTGKLKTLRDQVLATRPSPDALYWDFRTRKLVKLEGLDLDQELSLVASR